MSKIENFILTKVERLLLSVIDKIKKIQNKNDTDNGFTLVDLTPNDNALENKNYFQAISAALKNDKIKNIALTGPYGSGKSSIIKSFQKKNNKYSFLNISLASFKEDLDEEHDDEKEDRKNRLIERSILQQMLYGIDSDKLHDSRFRKISVINKKNALMQAILITIWLASVLSIYIFHPAAIKEITSNDEIIYISILIISYLLSIPALLLYDFFKVKNNISFKKMSLKNIEIETGEQSENSVLNRHIDEIIYFFQVTNYDLVVIEDLDRFGNPEIFVKLREINKLINDNSNTNGNIKFLYALKDDMFVHKNRAKFFDIIIPVIPVINSSNSLDKILKERLNDEKNEAHLKIRGSSFLREVSNYLNDLRLIHNIFNEFEIYYSELKNNNPDAVKLLALIVYKNVYPHDFEMLHQDSGMLYNLCKIKKNLVESKRDEIKNQILNLRKTIKNSDNESLNNISDLIKVYLFHISQSTGGSYGYINSSNIVISYINILNEEEFQRFTDQMNAEGSLKVQTNSGSNYMQIKFKDIENQVNPNMTFAFRCNAVKNKSTKNRHQLEMEIYNKEKQIAKISRLSLSELLLDNLKILDEELEKKDDKGKLLFHNNQLFRYLILDGHLDESYYLYSSNFYEGRKTANDQKFIMAIRGHNSLDYTHPINNPSEVCRELKDGDFSSAHILNISLVDYLVTTNSVTQLHNILELIFENMKNLEDFMKVYFSLSVNLDKFIQTFSNKFPDYAEYTILNQLSVDHLRVILTHVDSEYLASKMNTEEVITRYLNSNLEATIRGSSFGPIKKSIITELNLKIEDISRITDIPDWFDFICENNAYQINAKNISFLIHNNTDDETYKHINYTTVLQSKQLGVINYIEENIAEYFDDILSNLNSEVEESEQSIIALLNNDKLSQDQKFKLISKHKCPLNKLNIIPKDYWSSLVQHKKITATWSNVSLLLECDDIDEDNFIDLLNNEQFSNDLSNAKWNSSITDDSKNKLCWHIIKSEKISDISYKKITSNLYYKYKNFPQKISDKKLHTLAENNVISFNSESFEFAKERGLLSVFLIKYIDQYLDKKESLGNIDNQVIQKLILSNIRATAKIKLIYELKLDNSIKTKEFSVVLSELFLNNSIKLEQVDPELLKWISYATDHVDNSIRLVTLFLDYWTEEEVFNVLANLPEPFNKIALRGKRPRIINNKSNSDLASSLKMRGFISSAPVKGTFIEINTKHKK